MSDKETITKEKIAELLKAESGISQAVCEDIVSSFFTEIFNITSVTDKFVIKNFGRFYVNHKKNRPGFNLKTSLPVTIKSRKVLRFIPARPFKSQLNNHEG